MQNDEQTDHAFADEALSRLDLAEPSASLLRRVAEIPITHGPPAASDLWLAWSGWRARLLIALALAGGALVGGMPWDDATAGGAASAMPLLEEREGATAAEDELESALSLALGSDFALADTLLEESL